MSKLSLFTTVALLGTIAGPGVAFAQTTASATVDLNIRSGPGPQHEVIGVVEAQGDVTVSGCLQGSKWCRITHDGTEGWVYSDYLTAEVSGSAVVLTERYADVGVPVVTYEGGAATGAAGGAATGAMAGALIGGPIGAAVGAVAGAAAGGTAGAAIDPPERVRTYVTTNRVDPVYLEGDVYVGARLPETVQIQRIPEYDYSYAYVNGLPVLVGEERQIVYVVRNR